MITRTTDPPIVEIYCSRRKESLFVRTPKIVGKRTDFLDMEEGSVSLVTAELKYSDANHAIYRGDNIIRMGKQ
jgi:hypothetical protein